MGYTELRLPDSKEIYAYTRTLDDKKPLVVCSFAAEQTKLDVPEEFLKGEILIRNYAGSEASGEGGISSQRNEGLSSSMMLKPYEAIIVTL